MRVVVVSDTHIPDFARGLPAALLPALRRADLVLHAGDVTSAAVLEELAGFAQVQVALGNGDGPEVAAWGTAPVVDLRLEDVAVAMIHDSGPGRGREGRLRRRFPDADLVVFGHSHIPIDHQAGPLRLLNPGSPTWKRRQPWPTYATVEVSGSKLRTRIVELRG